MSIVKTENVIYEYVKRDEEGNVDGVIRAVNDVSLGIRQGDFIAIVGHNGSGKSTLAKHMNAILQPTQGTVWVDGMDTRQEERVWDIRQRAGMVFQNPDNQIIGQVVEEDVGFGPENLGVPTEEIWKRVEESLRAVGMYQFRSHSPNRLSGGQKQRVSIAGVLAMRPRCIVLDEPTAALDPIAEYDMYLKYSQMTHGRTSVFISHRLASTQFCDRILFLEQGRIVEEGSHKQLLDQKGHYARLFELQSRYYQEKGEEYGQE